MVAGIEIGHRARGLGEPVDLGEVATEGLERAGEQVLGHGRGAVEHQLQAREVGARAGRVLEHEEDHRRHEEHLGDAVAGDGGDDGAGVDLGHDDVGGAHVVAEQGVARAADVEERHRHQAHVVGAPHRELPRALADQVAEPLVAELGALGQPGGAAGVHLHGDVLGRHRGRGLGRPVALAPNLVALPLRVLAAQRDDGAEAGELVPDGLDEGAELGPDEQHLGAGVGDDEAHLGRRQAPVDRHQHQVRLGGAEQDLGVKVRVLGQDGDPAHGLTARGEEPAGDALGAGVELAIGGLAPLEDGGHPLGPGRPLVADQLGQGGDLSILGHPYLPHSSRIVGRPALVLLTSRS